MMDSQIVKIVATIAGGAIVGAGGWLWNTTSDNAKALGILESKIEDLEDRMDTASTRYDNLVNRILDLHPMQRSSFIHFIEEEQ